MSNLHLRKYIQALILILGLSLQFQALYACELMDDIVQGSCCCDMGTDDGCAMGGGCAASVAADDPCCQVSLSARGMVESTEVPVKLSTLLLELPQPPALIVSWHYEPNLYLSFPVSWESSQSDRHITGRYTYLDSARLRI